MSEVFTLTTANGIEVRAIDYRRISHLNPLRHGFMKDVLVVKVNRTFLTRLRWLGIIEGISTLVLFGIAMPLKYFAGLPEAVRIAGSLHGALFLALVAMFLLGTKMIPIPRRLAAAGIVGAVVPFGPFIVDRWLERVG